MSSLENRNSSSLDITSSTGVGTVSLIVQGLFVGSFLGFVCLFAFSFFYLTENSRLCHQETSASMSCNLEQFSFQKKETHSVELLIGDIKKVIQICSSPSLKLLSSSTMSKNLENYGGNTYIVYNQLSPNHIAISTFLKEESVSI